jgi:Flp pilus assembly protein TadD
VRALECGTGEDDREPEEAHVRQTWGSWILGAGLALTAATGALAQQAKMYGTVKDESGAGVPKAKVVLTPVDGGAKREVVTSGKGSYLIGILPAGRYQLKVEAEGLALISIKGEAVTINDRGNKESKWKIDGHVRPDKPEEIEAENGWEVTCDFVVGKATEITTATGEKAVASADQAYAMLTQQVQKGDCAGALPQIEKFTTDNPTNGRAFYLKGYCDAVLERDDEGIAALEKSRELDPNFPGPSTLLGKLYARNKRLPEAEAAFKKELEGTKNPPEIQLDALLSLGAVQRDQSKDAEAIATFKQAQAAAPNRPEPYVELSALYSKAGQINEAAAVLEQAKAVGADDPVALLNVGISYFNKKDYAHAESMFRRVTESKASNPDLAMAYGLLGKLQLRDGKNADAIASFEKSLELDPNGRLAQETRDTLKAIQPKKK